MGRVAASGGYFVAMAADRIVAAPGTITGSIGVYGGKFVMHGLWKKFGVNWETVYAGENATMWSPMRDYPAGAARRMDQALDFIYADFTKKLAKARKFSETEVDATARGRVWSGEDALRVGLVDRLGVGADLLHQFDAIADRPWGQILPRLVVGTDGLSGNELQKRGHGRSQNDGEVRSSHENLLR